MKTCRALVIVIVVVAWGVVTPLGAAPQPGGDTTRQCLSAAHIAAANRPRRVVVNFDVISGDRNFGGRDPAELVKWKSDFIDAEGSQIDSVWWCWGEGHQAPWSSKTMPLYDQPGYRKWVEDGIDIVEVFLEASKKRGIEAFYNYRINGSDNDLGPVRKIPMKEAHPDWLIHTWNANGYWNFAIPGVRDYKLSILREIAERYDVDGISLDFARIPIVLPPGRAWENRNHMTTFMRRFRSITQDAAKKRGRPLLIGARIPENLEGCHFDGLDVETWVREQLVDVLAPGVRSFDVDLAAFRRITAGTHVKLYPSIDDHHASDGYQSPPIEVYRGMAANWWLQGADGIQTFNFNHSSDFPYGSTVARIHLLVYREIGSSETLRYKDKVFVVQRRGGGHGPSVVPNPEDWTTPRLMYFNTNMFAPLPATLANDGKADTLLRVFVADDVAAVAERVERIDVHMLLSDPAAQGLSDGQTIGRGLIRRFGPDQYFNTPPKKNIEERIEVRLNNALLDRPTAQDGWLVFPAKPGQFAVGNNLLGIRVTERSPDASSAISVEKLEVHVDYRESQ